MNEQNPSHMLSGPYGTYNLSNFSVLVVDDSQALRELVTTTLKDIGVGTVRSAANGLQAIEYLKTTRATRGSTFNNANPPVDLLLVDLEMDLIDGILLTRWVRRHAASPNHFMRIAILSGSLNAGRIALGRNAGVHDFIAKPFTVKSIQDRLHAIIHHYHPFILTETYFGPDRRHQRGFTKGEEKRSHPDPVREKIPADAIEGVQVFKIPNYLEQVLTGINPGHLNMVKQEEAEKQSRLWVQDYADWALPNIQLMRQGLAVAQQNDEAGRVRDLEGIRRLGYEIEKVALYLDYPLLTRIARSLRGALDMAVVNWDAALPVIERHIDGLNMIARNHLLDEGGPQGEAVLAELGLGEDTPTPDGDAPGA